MVIESGGRTSRSSSGLSSEADSSGGSLDSLVEDFFGKVCVSPSNCEVMTIKNRKDRIKADRQSERDVAGPSSFASRRPHGFKPYKYPEDRKDNALHRVRVHSTHPHEAPLGRPNEGAVYHTPGPFSRVQSHLSIAQSECVASGFDGRSGIREQLTKPQPVATSTDKENGNNSEDEYHYTSHSCRSPQSQIDENNLEKLLLEKRGWRIVKVKADGACLFRSVAHQIFGDEEHHEVVRKQVVDYMLENREHFSPYVTEEFDHYINRKRASTCYGNHIEIQAIAELYNRPVEIYHDSVEPINVFHAEYSKEFPIRLSYHGRVHYNSVVDPYKPSFGCGLGMPNYQPTLSEPDLIAQALQESENTQLEETILRDKLAESEKGEIERCLEAQAVRESYYDYLSQLQLPVVRHSGGSPGQFLMGESATAVGAPSSSVGMACASTSGIRPFGRPPAVTLSPAPLPSSSRQTYLPPELRGLDEDSLVAIVMERSRNEYLQSLGRSRSSPSSVSHDASSLNQLLLATTSSLDPPDSSSAPLPDDVHTPST
ncbi:unnamed protein product [Dicrocoelium dendriticum]|nr:unnamed protein product [Dicrocoelium dendriticum]